MALGSLLPLGWRKGLELFVEPGQAGQLGAPPHLPPTPHPVSAQACFRFPLSA